MIRRDGTSRMTFICNPSSEQNGVYSTEVLQGPEPPPGGLQTKLFHFQTLTVAVVLDGS